jgi:hypothetical protein
MAAFGEAPVPPPAFKPGWTAIAASAGPGGMVMIQSQSENGTEEALGAYDLVKKSWAWSKEGEGWSGGLRFGDDLNTRWVKISARGETLIVDETGAVRCKYPRLTRIMIQPDGKALVIDSKDISLLDCANSGVNAKFTLPRKPTNDSVILGLPGYKFFIADLVNGVIEMSMADGMAKTLSATQKLALELPSGIRLQDLKDRIRSGKFSGHAMASGALLTIPCDNGKTIFCAVPMP